MKPQISKGLLRSFTAFILVATAVSSLAAQNEVKVLKSSQHQNEAFLFLVQESVVKTQWPNTLNLVNPPQAVTLLNPGACIRVGIIANGDNRDTFLEKTKLSFHVNFAGQKQEYPLAALAQFKQIKPEGGDFVTQALAAGGIKNPMMTMASLGVSVDSWCVPVNATDGTATVEAEIETPSGHHVPKPATIQIESFETGSKRTFKDSKEHSEFSQTYYRQPNPARLIPALQFAIAEQTAHPESDLIEIFAAFLSAALKADPVAAKDFLARISTQPPMNRAFGLLVARSAGYDISGVLNSMSAEAQEKINTLPPLADPYDLAPTEALFGHLDLMWATFSATGQFKPVQTIASTLSWRADYDEFDKARKTPNYHLTFTPSLARGLAYKAAGWSMGSFQFTDPLAADYIEFMLASANTPQAVKVELTGLSTNPAFKQEDKK
jgi:hypothetical protein